MKKTLLAAALLAGFATAGVAQAETSVTLYGILDTGYGYSRFKVDQDDVNLRSTRSGLTSGVVNGNRFGLKGSEDLGDGLRAIFQLEQGFDIGNGQPSTSRQFHRQAFVGLASDNWGSFTMGRQYSPSVTVGDLVSNGWSLGDQDKVFGGYGYANRVDNSFKYTTPDFAGFKAIVLYGSDGADTIQREDGTGWGATRATVDPITGAIIPAEAGSKERNSRVAAGLIYANGPISAGASYDRQGVTGADKAVTNWTVNAGYDFEVVKLTLSYGRDRAGKLGWAGDAGTLMGFDPLGLPSGFTSNNYRVGLSAPIGGGTLGAGWSRSTSNLSNEGNWGGVNADGDPNGPESGNINAYQLNYFYPLSKRTGVYAYGSYVNNVGYVRDLKGTEAGIGLNHKF